MTLCFNDLPPHTKEAAIKMGKMFYNDQEQWLKHIDKSGHRDLSTLATTRRIPVKTWIDVIKAFELWNDDIAKELMSLCLGAKE